MTTGWIVLTFLAPIGRRGSPVLVDEFGKFVAKRRYASGVWFRVALVLFSAKMFALATG